MAIIKGNNLNNNLAGTALKDTMYGYGGNDLMSGRAGNDIMYGGDGNDRMFGNNGNDIILGEAGNDQIRGGLGDDDLRGGFGTDDLQGGMGADKLKGGANTDFLFGGDGNDILLGGSADDYLFGGTGADAFVGGTGDDIAMYAEELAGVTAHLGLNASGGAATGDTYSGMESVYGSIFGDSLQTGQGGTAYGSGGNDLIYDSFGSELLIGGAGIDQLIADSSSYGGGADRFGLEHNNGYDIIYGFSDAQNDLLQIDNFDFNIGTSLTSGELVNNTSGLATAANAQFIYETDADTLWFDSNGTAAGGQVKIAEFVGTAAFSDFLAVSDFVVV